MDRTRRIPTARWAMPAFAAIMAGTAWVGYHAVGYQANGYQANGELGREPVAVDVVSRGSSSDTDLARPRLLPETCTRPATRLHPLQDQEDVAYRGTLGRSSASSPPIPWDRAVAAAHGGESRLAAGFDGFLEGPALGPALEPPRAVSDDSAIAARELDEIEPRTTPIGVTSESPTKSSSTENDAFRLADVTAAPATVWATPYEPGARSPQLEQIARQADSHTRRGFELASLKAHHSARAEFVRALRVVAQGLDSELATHVHSRALAAGLTALDEADDFVPVGSGLEGNLNLRAIIAGHATPELKLAVYRSLTPLRAVQCYMDYAREQLAVASGNEVAGSMALHALGKLHRSLAEQQGANRPTIATKALTYLQASVQVCPQNYFAFNDLGVLLARGGRYAEAATSFQRSLAIAHSATASINLATLERRLGNSRQAEWIERQAVAAAAADRRAAAGGSAGAPPVVWVSPQEFAGSYAGVAGPWQPAPVKRDATNVAPATPIEQASRGWSWNPFQKQQ